jgi:hypothetical protein
MNDDKPDVSWIQDSSGVSTCHVNDGSTFQQSLIGTIEYRSESWHIILKDKTDITPEEGCSTLARARRFLETYYRKHTPSLDRMAPRVAQAGRA